MKEYTVKRYEGELLGPIDWSYNFLSHFQNHCVSDERKQEYCNEAIERLKLLEANPSGYQVTNDGGWPRMWWHDVIAVGMYDGWPYWKPVPSVLTRGTLGPEWHCFSSLTGIEPKKQVQPTP